MYEFGERIWLTSGAAHVDQETERVRKRQLRHGGAEREQENRRRVNGNA